MASLMISVVSRDVGVTVIAAFNLNQTPRYALFDSVFNASGKTGRNIGDTGFKKSRMALKLSPRECVLRSERLVSGNVGDSGGDMLHRVC